MLRAILIYTNEGPGLLGELAEMVVYQGPLLGNNMTLGATGFWQNMMRPTTYYLTSSYEHLDATRAELIGGIDGKLINVPDFPIFRSY